MITLPDATAEVPADRSFFEQIIKIQDKRKPGEEGKRDNAKPAKNRPAPYRTDTPDRSVNIRAAMFIEASSWNRSLAA
jgi:hypothetical protein